MSQATLGGVAAGAAPAGSRLVLAGLDDPAWTGFGPRHPDAGPFHHPAWAETLAASYGYRPLAALLLGPTGAAAAGLPLMEVRSRLTGHRFVALPFTDHCPPLAGSADDLAALTAALGAWARGQAGACRLEVHAELPGAGIAHRRDQGLRHLLSLEPDSDRVFAGFRGGPVSRAIRKAVRSGVEVRLERSPAALRAYYELHCRTRHRQGVPVQPRRFFSELGRRLLGAGLGIVALATVADQRRPVAGAVFLAWNGQLIYKYGASDPAQWERRPNNLVLWRAMEWGCANRCHVFDFGRTEAPNQGLREFKRRWGALELPLVHTTIGRRPATGAGEGARRLAPLLRRAPAGLGRLIGATLYAHFA